MYRKRYPKEVVLKDCQEVILRLVEPADKERLLRFYESMDPSLRWFLKEDPCSPETVDKWIERQAAGRAFTIVATCGDTIVGHAGLLLRPYGGRKHVARLRVMVAMEYRSKGLGTWLVFDLTKRAMEMGMEKLRADFVAGLDDRAISAMKKMGFMLEGRLRNYVKDSEGNHHDYEIMIKDLAQEWSDF